MANYRYQGVADLQVNSGSYIVHFVVNRANKAFYFKLLGFAFINQLSWPEISSFDQTISHDFDKI